MASKSDSNQQSISQEKVMPDYLGNVAVPEIVPSGVFPLT
jgi:hypothetical protein